MSLTDSLTTRLCADLTDVTLADEDSNSIPTDDVNGAIKSWDKVEKNMKKVEKKLRIVKEEKTSQECETALTSQY